MPSIPGDTYAERAAAGTLTQRDDSTPTFNNGGTRLPVVAPVTPRVGDQYFDPVAKTTYTWDGSAWDTPQGGSTGPAGPVGPTGAAGQTGAQGAPGTGVGIDVRSAPYNATGDGTTNDSAAIQAAIDACHTAGGGTVYFSTGTYRCNVKIRPYVTLRGAGWRSILKAVDNSTTPVVGSENAAQAGPLDPAKSGVTNLLIDGNAAGGATGRGIEFVSGNGDAYWSGSPPGGADAIDIRPNDPSCFIEGVMVYNCNPPDAAVVIGQNMRGSWVRRSFIFNSRRLGMLIAATDTMTSDVQVGSCADGIKVTGGANSLTNVKCWWTIGSDAVSDPTHPYVSAYSGDGFILEKPGSQYAAARMTGCETQDCVGFGIRLKNTRANIITGQQSGGDAAGAVLLEGTSLVNRVDVSLVFADRAPGTDACAVMLDGGGALFNDFRIHDDNAYSRSAGYTPVKVRNGGVAATNSFNGFNERSYADGGNFSGTINPNPRQTRISRYVLTGNATVNAPSATDSLPGAEITFIFIQDATGGRTVTWNAAYIGAPPIKVSANSMTSVRFINTGTTTTPAWTYLGTGIDDPPYVYEQAANIDVSSPMPWPIATGSFTAQRGTVDLDIELSAVIAESLGGWAKFDFYYAPTGTTPITPKHQADALTAGVVKKQIGSLAAVQGGLGLATRLTGLTPGTTYNWEIPCSIVGGAGVVNPTAFTNPPTTLSMSKNNTGFPEQCGWGGLSYSDGSFSIIKADHVKTYTDKLVATFTATQMGQANANHATWSATTPDGTRIIRINQGDANCAIVTTGAGTDGATAPAVQGIYTTASTPTGVTCAPDNATAWIALATTGGGVQKVTLATGVVGTAIVPNATYQQWDVTVSPANDYLYTCSGTSAGARMQRIRLSDNTVVNDIALSGFAAGPGQLYMDISADGAYVYIVSPNAKRLWKVRTSDMTEQATVTMTRTPTGVAVFPDGQSLVVSSSDIASGNAQVLHFRTDDLSIYTQWGNQLTGALGNQQTGSDNAAYDIALGPKGAIYVPNFTKKFLNSWFGGWMSLHTDAFYNGKLSVRVRGGT